jgi:hypothetical protein
VGLPTQLLKQNKNLLEKKKNEENLRRGQKQKCFDG